MVLSSLSSPAAYLQQLVLELPPAVDANQFAEAAQVVIGREDALMSQFIWRHGELWQYRLNLPPPLWVLANESTSLADFLRCDRQIPLPLLETTRPLWRATLRRNSNGASAWIWTHHHAICDGASYPLLVDRIYQRYDALTSNEPPGVSEDRAIGFYEFTAKGADRSAGAPEFWRERFRPNDSFTALPEIRGFDRSTPDSTIDGARRHSVALDAALDQKLRAFAREIEVTMSTIVSAALGIWLARLTSETRAIVAVMRAARHRPGTRPLIAPLVNTVPLLIATDAEIPVQEFLQNLRREMVSLREFEQTSLADLAVSTGFVLGSDGPPLVLNFQRAAIADELRAGGLAEERCGVSLVQSNDVPLMLSAWAEPHLRIELISRPEKIEDAVPQALAHGLRAILSSFVERSEQRVGQIEIITAEDSALLDSSSRGPILFVSQELAQDFIEEQIRLRPEALAAEQAGRTLTFAELDSQSEHLARSLITVGVAKKNVGIVLPPSPEILCAMLGILRAGGAIFLLNPMSPAKERAGTLARLKPALVLTDPSLLEETRAAGTDTRLLSELTASVSDSAARPRAEASDLAYLVHTSGSTGEKKFVEIEHRSFANTIAALRRSYDLRPGDRRISRAMPGNDYFLTETIVALSAGATLVFPERCGAMSLADFVASLRRDRITVTGIPTSYWHEWVRAMNETETLPPDLRLVICSMEKANPQLVEKWQRLVRDRVRWLNAYGPAEATIVATVFELGRDGEVSGANVPIGRPVANTEVYLLDPDLRLVPPGATGEICIAGIGVGRGYRGDEESTREKFVLNPHARTPAYRRLYRTGDFGYVDQNAQIVFLGRRDQQIKIHGHRIELGEVEIALEEHPQVRHAIATAEGEDSTRRLVAHLVPSGTLDSAQFRTWLRERLPPRLRPADFLTMEKFPVMPTGKIDRRALSAAYRARPAAVARGDGANPIEEKLLQLWSELLGSHQFIGRSDNFFDLGGNSLLAIRLLSRVEKDWGAIISLHELFTHPTLAEFATLLARGPAAAPFTSLIRLNSAENGLPLFVIHGWSGGVFHFLDFARSLHEARPVFGLQAIEHAEKPRHQSFTEMARHYADEMMAAHPGVAYELFGHSLGGMIAYATACELRKRGQKVARLYLADTTPLNLPSNVHRRFVIAHLEVKTHLHAVAKLPAHAWYDYWRARRRSLQEKLRRWPSRENPARQPMEEESDYYDVIGRDFVPERAPIEIKLFTPCDRPATEIYWRYLVGPRVENFFVEGDHVDLFSATHLDSFLRAFARASEIKSA